MLITINVYGDFQNFVTVFDLDYVSLSKIVKSLMKQYMNYELYKNSGRSISERIFSQVFDINDKKRNMWASVYRTALKFMIWNIRIHFFPTAFVQNLFKGVDRFILCCCGKCYSESIPVSPICTIRIEKVDYFLDDAIPSCLSVRGVNDMTYREIMEPIKCMEKLCITGRRWLNIFNARKKGYDNIFRFQDYITEHGLNIKSRPNSSISFLKRKISLSMLRYRRSWPNNLKNV
ncbi:hypothetical protein PMAC_002988 [Pneumocystis sp. 'macacae']|nr:hypothetical protein PMAC_002988 [Pneumocystis sp. 'macacae']